MKPDITPPSASRTSPSADDFSGRRRPTAAAGPTRRDVHESLVAAGTWGLLATTPSLALAASAADLEMDAARTLGTLYRHNSVAEAIGRQAKAILVFPKIVKAGLIVGGSYGEGVMLQSGQVIGYYSSASASWGWQAGAQSYAYVLFLMNDTALRHLDQSKGWEVGVGPSVVVVNEGVARSLSTTTLKEDAYAFVTDQQGLMASLSIEGTKITRLRK
ncbi:MAG: YSC84-related protein [Rubrivivax sp.]